MAISSPDDQAPIAIRPIRGDDHDRLRDSHDRLSPETRYRRFLSTKPRLTPADTRYLVEVDGCDHFALVAVRTDQPGEPIVGVARFVRFPERRDVAEMAIVVNDAYQRQGLGAALVTRLADAAVARGVRRFRATALPDNQGIRRLLENLSEGPARYWLHGGLAEMEVELPGADQLGGDCGAAGAGLSPAA